MKSKKLMRQEMVALREELAVKRREEHNKRYLEQKKAQTLLDKECRDKRLKGQYEEPKMTVLVHIHGVDRPTTVKVQHITREDKETLFWNYSKTGTMVVVMAVERNSLIYWKAESKPSARKK